MASLTPSVYITHSYYSDGRDMFEREKMVCILSWVGDLAHNLTNHWNDPILIVRKRKREARDSSQVQLQSSASDT